jgi:predicted anti-sigma-YlaC factor YlaD
MTADGCADARLSLGAYVLGALDPGERGRVDAHLALCDDCRDELASFAALPGLLSRVSVAEVELVPEPPRPEVLRRLLAAVSHERRHDRRVRWLVSVAAAVIVLAAASVAGVALSTSHHPTQVAATSTVRATDPVTHVTASVVEWSKAWGAALEVKVTGGTISAYGGTCHLVAVGVDGTQDVAASWSAIASNKIQAQGATALHTSEIASFKVVGSDGSTLVTIPAHPAST